MCDKLPDREELGAVGEIGIYDFKFKAAPSDLWIGNMLYQKGFAFEGLLNIFDNRIYIRGTVNPTNGVVAEGYLPELKIGKFLKLTENTGLLDREKMGDMSSGGEMIKRGVYIGVFVTLVAVYVKIAGKII